MKLRTENLDVISSNVREFRDINYGHNCTVLEGVNEVLSVFFLYLWPDLNKIQKKSFPQTVE